MAEIRKDLVRNNWVAIAPNMALKPCDFPIRKRGIDPLGNNLFCPFCEGNEESTPPEVFSQRSNNSAPNSPGWSVRVVPNKFSVFDLDGVWEKNQTGIYYNYYGLGRQEVIIETPEHGVDWHDYKREKIAEILQVIRQRYNDLARDARIKYIQVYKNRGIFAGASLEHSHSQMIGLPYFPHCNWGLTDYYQKNKQCLLCSIIKQERQSEERLIFESRYFLLVCPYAPRFSYESWIIPKDHGEHYGSISDAQIIDLAHVCRVYMRMIMETLQNPAYNFIINTAPVNLPYQPGFHWFVEITPRLLVPTGVDISTGLYVNPVAPELAAALFKEEINKFI